MKPGAVELSAAFAYREFRKTAVKCSFPAFAAVKTDETNFFLTATA